MHQNIAIIYEAAGADPVRDRMVRTSGNLNIHIIVVGSADEVLPAAREMVELGVSLIQLCGGTSAAVRARVKADLEARATVSAVLFGIESLGAAARYSQAFEEGAPPPEAFLIIVPGWKGTPQFHKSFPPQETTFLIVGDETLAARAAADFVAAGTGLIELQGLYSLEAAASVIEAVQGRAAVGVHAFDLNT